MYMSSQAIDSSHAVSHAVTAQHITLARMLYSRYESSSLSRWRIMAQNSMMPNPELPVKLRVSLKVFSMVSLGGMSRLSSSAASAAVCMHHTVRAQTSLRPLVSTLVHDHQCYRRHWLELQIMAHAAQCCRRQQ